ncbi:unnamed protein product [Brachionus calyciflorus]|uniref:SH2 domain-containing protein n=1 Tax=Brachionus calyciflorus TaxID=104777 RepID=A0A813R3P9_9BILA|nr:unnamed protein product [Brachionus calyciflorus]
MKSLNQESDMDSDIDLLLQPYYFDNLSVDSSVAVLKAIKEEGAFLIRKRTTDDIVSQPYAISIYYGPTIIHSRINRNSNGGFTLEHSKIKKVFESVPKMIEFLEKNDTCKLTTKYSMLVSKIVDMYRTNPKIFRPIGDDEDLNQLPYFISKKSKEDLEIILLNIKKDGTFFITKHSENNLSRDKSIKYIMGIYKSNKIFFLNITKSVYDEYSIELNEPSFRSIPELVKHYNYAELRIDRERKSTLRIFEKYILDLIR